MTPSPIASFGVFKPRSLSPNNTSFQLWVLSHTVFDGQKFLLATGVHADDDQGTELVIFAPEPAVNTVSPDVDPLVAPQIALAPP